MKNKKIVIGAISAIVVIILSTLIIILNKEKTYNVTFDYNTNLTNQVIQVNENESIAKPTDPIKEGYKFNGWYYNNIKFDFNTKINEDIILEAIWELEAVETKWNIILDLGEGQINTLEISEGETIGNIPVPVREGYKFIGWYEDNKNVNLDTKITRKMTLVAKWEETEKVEIKKYLIVFDTSGGSQISNQTILEGNIINKPTNPTKEGYIFKGWYYNNNEYNFLTKITKDITLKALWEQKVCTIMFNSAGGNSIESKTVKYGSKINKPNNPTKDGYTFKEWQLEGNAYDFDSNVKNDITLTATWEKNIYTITFDNIDGGQVLNQKVEHGDKATKPTNPIKEGHIFKEWQYNGIKYNFDTIVKENITLKALWEPKMYTITFDSTGGNKVSNQTITYGDKVAIPTTPTKEYYIFKEWQLNDQTYDFNTPVHNNITLKAIWETNYFTVTFDSDGGNSISNIKVEKGNKVSKPTNPIKEGHIFKEWQSNNKTYDFNTPILNDITLKAIWEKENYIVSFNCDGGSVVEHQYLKYGDKVSKPNNPTKDGYTFIEWQLDNKTYNFDTIVKSNITIKAKWYKNYSTGDVVELGTEKFNVIKDNGDTIKMFAKYGLDSNYRQSKTSPDKKSFSSKYGWIDGEENLDIQMYDGNVKTYINNYASYLKQFTGDNNINVTLITLGELVSLGCTKGSRQCYRAEYATWIVNRQGFWTRTSYSNDEVYAVDEVGEIGQPWVVSQYTIRPVVTISKEVLSNIE